MYKIRTMSKEEGSRKSWYKSFLNCISAHSNKLIFATSSVAIGAAVLAYRHWNRKENSPVVAEESQSTSSSVVHSHSTEEKEKKKTPRRKVRSRDIIVPRTSYKNVLLGVTLDYPTHWERVENFGPSLPLKIICRNEGQAHAETDSSPQILLLVEDLQADMTTNEYCEASRKHMEETLGGMGTLRFLAQKNIALGDDGGVQLLHTQTLVLNDGTGTPQTVKTKQLTVMVCKHETAYSLQYVGRVEEFDGFYTEAKKTLHSLRLLSDAEKVFSAEDVRNLARITYTDSLTGLTMKVPTVMRPSFGADQNVVVTFAGKSGFRLGDDLGSDVFSVSLTRAKKSDFEGKVVSSLDEFVKFNKERIEKNIRLDMAMHMKYLENDERMNIGDQEAMKFSYVQSDKQDFDVSRDSESVALVECVQLFHGEYVCGVIFSAGYEVYNRVKSLFGAILNSILLEEPSQVEEQKWMVYDNPQYSMNISFPCDWSYVEEAMPGNIVTLAYVPDDVSSQEEIVQVHVMMETFSAEITLNDLVEHLKLLAKEVNPSTQGMQFEGEDVEISVGDQVAKEFTFVQTLRTNEGMVRKMKFLNRCMVRGKAAFYLQYGTGESNFSAKLSAARGIMDSFQSRE